MGPVRIILPPSPARHCYAKKIPDIYSQDALKRLLPLPGCIGPMIDSRHFDVHRSRCELITVCKSCYKMLYVPTNDKYQYW